MAVRMFESLSDRFSNVFSSLRGKGRLSESDVDSALREVRLALLEADVNVLVTKNLLARIKERALGADVHQSLSPGQQVIKIVHEELIRNPRRDRGTPQHLAEAPVDDSHGWPPGFG